MACRAGARVVVYTVRALRPRQLLAVAVLDYMRVLSVLCGALVLLTLLAAAATTSSAARSSRRNKKGRNKRRPAGSKHTYLPPTAPHPQIEQLPRNPFVLQPPYNDRSPPPGHLRSVFSLPKNRGNVTELDSAPDGATFFSKYAPTRDAQQRSSACLEAQAKNSPNSWQVCDNPGQGTPFVLRQLAAGMPAFDKLASDEAVRSAYLHNKVPPKLVGIEKGAKRENRRHTTVDMSMAQFLEQYRHGTAEESLYTVSLLPWSMATDIHLPSWLRCGGGAQKLHSLNLWMGPGGTESVIHTDGHDNLNCVFAGRKQFFLVDSAYYHLVTNEKCGWVNVEDELQQSGETGLSGEQTQKKYGYGEFSKRINVSAVDLLEYPCWANLPYLEATLYPGDCLFIPQHWVHHVASHGGAEGRSIATNLWWDRPEKYEPDNCVASTYGDTSPIPAADCEFKQKAEDSLGSVGVPACHPSRGRKHRRREKQEL